MSLNPNDEPALFEIKADELSLSGQSLIQLMEEILTRDISLRFRARGWSMAPFIRDRDVITVTSLRGISPRVGDIVAFIHPVSEKLVVHRIVSRRGSAFFIRGDGVNGESDGMIPSSNLLGRVTRIERNGHPICLGLGPERFLIAWLSRTGFLVPIGGWLASWRKRITGKR